MTVALTFEVMRKMTPKLEDQTQKHFTNHVKTRLDFISKVKGL